jgi:hypothetical protein
VCVFDLRKKRKTAKNGTRRLFLQFVSVFFFLSNPKQTKKREKNNKRMVPVTAGDLTDKSKNKSENKNKNSLEATIDENKTYDINFGAVRTTDIESNVDQPWRSFVVTLLLDQQHTYLSEACGQADLPRLHGSYVVSLPSGFAGGFDALDAKQFDLLLNEAPECAALCSDVRTTIMSYLPKQHKLTVACHPPGQQLLLEVISLTS